MPIIIIVTFSSSEVEDLSKPFLMDFLIEVGFSFRNLVWSMYPVFISMDKIFLIQVTFMMFLVSCSSLHLFMDDEGCIL